MKTVTITLELEDDKFAEMERIILKHGYKSFKEKASEAEWVRFVIETYENTEPYLDCNDGELEEAYYDMRYDM